MLHRITESLTSLKVLMLELENNSWLSDLTRELSKIQMCTIMLTMMLQMLNMSLNKSMDTELKTSECTASIKLIKYCVILDQGSNKQKFFGSGQVDNTSKKVARDDFGHTNDITSMDVSSCRKLATTKQNGSKSVVLVWDSSSGEKKARFKLKKGGREITAIAICPQGKMVAMTYNSNDHNLSVYDIATEKKVAGDKTGPNFIYHISWFKKEGEAVIAIADCKHIAHWDLDNKFKKKKGVHGSAGFCYTGGANSRIYHWKFKSCFQLQKTYDVHGKGFCCSIRWCDGKNISGAKDGNVVISNLETGEAKRTIDVGCLMRSVYMDGSNIIAGLRKGNIIEINSGGKITEIMNSHSDGEAWGLDIDSSGTIVTSGDDNHLYSWSIKDRKSTSHGEIYDEYDGPKKNGASSLTSYAVSKCTRAVAINSTGNGDFEMFRYCM
ncbi:unnamed protein product [Moneuplotes crassus]|uniref:Uncharacterized protein n=1 Tax=Euplotes crassus TaxID=5936 RepID=A0AAD1Y613_EUPCR|nr:unnamed protein product [Moneuplotes crassus]